MGGSSKGAKGDSGGLDLDDARDLIALAANTNRIDTRTPFGSALFSGPNRRELDITLSREQQALLEGQEGIQQNLLNFGGDLASALSGGPVTGEGLPGLPDPVSVNDVNRNRVEDAIFDRGATRLDRAFGDRRRALEQQLTDQGIPRGSEAFERAISLLGEQENDARSSLINDAIIGGGAEQSREAALLQSLTAQQAGLRQQGLGERTGLRNQQLFELARILGQTTPTQPTFPGPSQVDTMGATNLAFANQAGQQNRQDAKKGQTADTASQIGRAAILGF